MKVHQRGRLQNDRGAQDACPADEQHTQTDDHPVGGAQVRRSFAATIENQKLVSDQHRFGDYATEPSGLCQPDQRNDQMKQKVQRIAHPGNRTKTSQALAFTVNFGIRHGHVTTFNTVWTNVKNACGIKGRWHDNRHTFITNLAESGEAADGTIMDIAGHVSHRMLKHYSHIGMEAKRRAVDSLTKKPEGVVIPTPEQISKMSLLKFPLKWSF